MKLNVGQPNKHSGSDRRQHDLVSVSRSRILSYAVVGSCASCKLTTFRDFDASVLTYDQISEFLLEAFEAKLGRLSQNSTSYVHVQRIALTLCLIEIAQAHPLSKRFSLIHFRLTKYLIDALHCILYARTVLTKEVRDFWTSQPGLSSHLTTFQALERQYTMKRPVSEGSVRSGLDLDVL